MVFDVPAESGGALSVLIDFYNDYKNDKNNKYIFIVSKPLLTDFPNIKVLRFPWIKKSWLHRLYFDMFIAPKLVKKYEVDEILSLQNIIIPFVKIRQIVYVHNSLPFVEYRFSIFNDRLLWLYQNLLSKGIYRSIKRADKVIVQTEWMKEACVEKLYIDKEKIEVKPPKIEIEVKRPYKRTNESLKTFFYPASGLPFKNHKLIIDACLKLKEEGLIDYDIVFTLNGNENKNIASLYRIVKENKLPVTFMGKLSREKVFEYYSKSSLIFPSYIETVGLPLIEAKMHGTPILASNCNFSHEVLFDYTQKKFFNPFDSSELFKLLKVQLFS
ncbi:Glycosyltransferase involved in cell wall bisynthesis [Paenibacillus sp. UNCCL117]|nr:Glycosyltransferase involved in cell wall bisynthesis [Paenibacillus sp. cl123]SFW37283.1 Glycosyltransferase involved in cell wall bisynthesis [Paenibacillus sp. UNCCL117]